MLLLVSSLIISTSAGIEPIGLGQGRIDKAINLDVGSKQSSVYQHFGMNGFASPLISQPMELDPGAMVSQSESLRDSSQSLRDQSRSLYNDTSVLLDRTSAFAEKVEKDSARVESLKEAADISANSSLTSALLAGDYFNNTRTIYNLTKISQRKAELASRMGAMGVGASSIYNSEPKSTNDIEYLRQEVTTLSERVEDLERRISELEDMTKAK